MQKATVPSRALAAETLAMEGELKAERLVRSEMTCVSEGESPSSPEAKLPEFRTKVMDGKV
jgi:hypothetical protein